MATSPQTKNARSDDQPDPEPRSRPNGQRGDDVPAQVVESTDDVAVATAEAVRGIVRQSQDAVVRPVAMWTEMMARLNPFVLLSQLAMAGAQRGDQREEDDARFEVTGFPGRAWADGIFDTFETALATQRRNVDQVLAAQRQLVGQFLDAGAGTVAGHRAGIARVDAARSTRH